MNDLDDKIAAANARLDVRQDPEPPPELPPVALKTSVIMDLRLVVTEESCDRGTRLTWKVLDAEGKAVHPQTGLGSIVSLGAQLVAGSSGWRQDFHRACKRMVEANANAARFTPGPLRIVQ